MARARHDRFAATHPIGAAIRDPLRAGLNIRSIAHQQRSKGSDRNIQSEVESESQTFSGWSGLVVASQGCGDASVGRTIDVGTLAERSPAGIENSSLNRRSTR